MNTEIIGKTAQATLAGTMSFPDAVCHLLAAGVEYYHVDYVGLRKTFYGKDADIAITPISYGELPAVASKLSIKKLKAAILDSQTKGQKYRDFTHRAMEAGVQSYFAFLRGKRVTYLGRAGDQHVEWFPGAAPAKSPDMTEDEYFDKHIPHRVNLLTTFRNRYSPKCKKNIGALPWDKPRDFFRCSKDISILMVRFFCDELGVGLPKGKSELEDKNPSHPHFKPKPFKVSNAEKDPRFDSLVKVLRAANRAVAHINPSDVNHELKEQKDDERLIEVIDWIEKLIETHMYGPNGRKLADAMELENNDMRIGEGKFSFP